jgi:hypothetical protein
MRELTGGFSWIMSVVVTIDYAGEPAGPTVGSHRIAVWRRERLANRPCELARVLRFLQKP